MPDLLDRLKTALADHNAIEREIGAGDMATDYLAEDLKHQRKVAVKVLRPGLAAALGPERFLREFKTTGRLNHPHILTRLESGEADRFLTLEAPHMANLKEAVPAGIAGTICARTSNPMRSHRR